MGEVYEPCGGCGADHPSKRCINCFHDFGSERPDHQNKEGLEASAVAFLLEMATYFERRPTNGEDMAFWANVTNKRNCEGIASLVSSLREENERLRKERDEAHSTAKKLTKALVGLTPGGSEYFSRSALLEDYFADTEACTRVIRDRFESGHAAKIANVDAKRDLRASQAQLKIYREALEAFVNVRDQFPESAKLIDTRFDGHQPISVTVTLDQFRAARTALSQEAGE